MYIFNNTFVFVVYILYPFSPSGGELGCGDMVLFFEWHQIAVEPKNSHSCVPMTGEDTGLEPLALPLAGYLGKVSVALVFLSWSPAQS